MFTGPVGPVEVFFYWPETVFGNFYWPGAIGSPLASSPVIENYTKHKQIKRYKDISVCGTFIIYTKGILKCIKNQIL